jgi:hypothetical protein
LVASSQACPTIDKAQFIWYHYYGGDNLDKTWIVCDNTSSSPFYGNCYVEFDNFGLGDLEMMVTSTDSGLTWGTPMTTGNQATGIGGQPVVQPSGTVIVPLDDAFESSLQVFNSKDGGKSWSSTTTITTFSEHFVAGNIRAPNLIAGEIDKSGKVYVVFYDCRFENGCPANDILLTSPKDGIKWSAPARVPTDPVGSGVDHFLPSIGIDHATKGRKAHLVVTYYYYPNANCDPSTCQLDVGYVSSTNGGNVSSDHDRVVASHPVSPILQRAY